MKTKQIVITRDCFDRAVLACPPGGGRPNHTQRCIVAQAVFDAFGEFPAGSCGGGVYFVRPGQLQVEHWTTEPEKRDALYIIIAAFDTARVLTDEVELPFHFEVQLKDNEDEN